MKPIKIFGENTKNIEEKEHFIAFHYSAEGRDCVELVPAHQCCNKYEELYKEIDLGHGDSDYICVNKDCENCEINYYWYDSQ